MQITLDIPDELAMQALPLGVEPARAALEAIAIEGYRARRLSESQVRRMLGYETRMEVHALLAEHDVDLDYDMKALENDIRVSDQMYEMRLAAAMKQAG